MNIKSLSDSELTDLMNRVIGEHRNRAELARLRDNNPLITMPLLASMGVEDGGEWKQPRGEFDAYPKSWKVMWDGREWENIIDNNVWEPGVSGWREVVEEGKTPTWVQPLGAHDSFQQGDKVFLDDKIWVSLYDNNTWKPGVYGWEEINGD